MKYPQARLLVMSKAPEAGKVKTRLIPLLGAEAAADLYRSMLWNTLDKMTNANLCPVHLCCSPTIEHEFFKRCQSHFGVTLEPQIEGDLGQRMSHAIETALHEVRCVVVIGADCPTLAASDLDAALVALDDDSDVVMGPASDGGYYLIGMRAHNAGLFKDIVWGSPTVLATTEQRIHKMTLECTTLTIRADIDTPDDYSAWHESGGKFYPEA